MQKIINVTIDFDHPMMFVQIIDISEREELDDVIDEADGKQVNDFSGFLKDIDVDVNFTDEFQELKKHVEQLLSSRKILESYSFASGEVGYGFYAVVNDEEDELDVEEFLDFV